MDKNIAAFLDKNAYTVQVCFKPSSGQRKYTYVCNIPGVKIGDWIVVDAPDFNSELTSIRNAHMSMTDINDYLSASELVLSGIPKLVMVVGVDTDVDIAPNSDIAHGWVVSVLDLTNYKATINRNSKIAGLAADAYKASMRKSFAERILGDMDSDSKTALLGLLNK